jgi:hypothetical protein
MDAWLEEMKAVQKRMEAKIEASMRSPRSFKTLSSPGWISTKPGQVPCKKNRMLP